MLKACVIGGNKREPVMNETSRSSSTLLSLHPHTERALAQGDVVVRPNVGSATWRQLVACNSHL
jgi:hypothetical protein